MIDITRLPDEWRPQTIAESDECLWEASKRWYGEIHARELEDALPKWNSIYSLAPEIGQRILFKFPNKDHRPEFSTWDGVKYADFKWRPLCDLDYPPEDMT